MYSHNRLSTLLVRYWNLVGRQKFSSMGELLTIFTESNERSI